MALTKIDGEFTSPDFAGQNIATTGSNTAGSFIPTSSTAPANGVYLAAANKVAIATNGTGKIFIDSSGRLLVGLSSSSGEPIAAFQGRSNDANDSGIVAITKTGTNPSGSIGELRFATGSDLNKYYGMILCAADGSTSSTSLPGVIRFSTTASGATSPTERLRIDSSGKVYFGNFSDVANAGYIDKATTGDKELNIVASRSTAQNRDIVFKGRSNTEAMRIDNSGNVGIGTSSPSALLHLESASSPKLILKDTTNNCTFKTYAQNSNAHLGTESNHDLIFDTNNTERMRIDSLGNVAIGTSDADISGNGSSFVGLSIIETSSNRRGFIEIGDNQNADTGGIGDINFVGHYQNSGHKIMASVRSAAEGSTSGQRGANVKIFTKANGSSSLEERMRITSDGQIRHYLYDRWFASNGSTTVGFIGRANEIVSGGSGTDFGANATNNLVFGTNSTQRMMLDSSGNVQIGTSTSNGAKFKVSDGGAHEFAFFPNDGGVNSLVNYNRSGGAYIDMSIAAKEVKFLAGTSPTERMRIESGGATKFSGTIAPSADNTHNIGGSSLRWSAIYAVNGTIQTSDQREKTNVLDSSLGFDFIKSLRPVSYKWINGGQVETGVNEEGELQYTSHAGQRTHWGFIAQEVKQSVDDAGVDFGGWVLTDKDDSDSQQALRYDQFIAPLTKALQEAIAKIETLETQNADLLSRVTALEG